MKTKFFTYRYLESIMSYFLIILFTYTGLTKLLERERFYLNLLNSPVLPIEKTWLLIASWIIPFLELLSVLLLILPSLKLKGLYLSTGLLCLYTTYVASLVFLAPYEPCSCGGISSVLSWPQQLWVTLFCLFIAGILLYKEKQLNPNTLTKHNLEI